MIQSSDLPDLPDLKWPNFDAPCFDVSDINLPDPYEADMPLLDGIITEQDFKPSLSRKTGIWQTIKNIFKF